MNILMNILLSIAFIMLLLFIYLLFKNENTYKQRCKINNAIYRYTCKCIDNENYYDHTIYDAKEHYDRTLWRLWDWGCENIVDKETYEKIKDYL